ncbi:TetR/AcrR family transcriptional regulator [Listeria sp. PSOL-1]|uniref:TetR/AcrR family transcriptional regulator n=1 Tax=Listeria sp. PSOL-1 TaxID=1844999 RepID=UPI0013D3052B|nr:TetR family transcriptional regulator [Listeria sp. PSOL-1]
MITNETIMNATLKMIAKNGIKGSTTRQLAEAAEINEATIFKKFKNKENLIHLTLEMQADMIKQEIEQFFNRPFCEVDYFLKQTYQFIASLYEKYRDFMMVSLKEVGSRDMAFIDPSVVEYLHDKVRKKVQQLFGKEESSISESISLVLNSVILFIMVEKVKADLYGRKSKIKANAEELTNVLKKLAITSQL